MMRILMTNILQTYIQLSRCIQKWNDYSFRILAPSSILCQNYNFQSTTILKKIHFFYHYISFFSHHLSTIVFENFQSFNRPLMFLNSKLWNIITQQIFELKSPRGSQFVSNFNVVFVFVRNFMPDRIILLSHLL